MALFSQQSDDEDDEESDETTSNDLANNFDGDEGFAKYLAPYAAALILSIGATVAIFKFILLDY
jgi:hypothetical protein